MTYPSHWPRPNPRKTNSLQTRISEQQKHDLFERRITTRDLAKLLDVHEQYLSYMFPGKERIIDKKPLIEARKAYKLEIAKQVIEGRYSVGQAAKVANVSYNTMKRFITRAKVQNSATQ